MIKLEQIDIQFYLENKFVNIVDLISVGLDIDLIVFKWILDND